LAGIMPDPFIYSGKTLITGIVPRYKRTRNERSRIT
jgi:hypothetical protein